MKKKKIIIPAFSLLALSVVASITGTVAWFTSVTNASFTTDLFEVKKLEGSISMVVTKGVGTTVEESGSDVKSYTVKPDKTGDSTNALTHGSFDHKTQTPWAIVNGETGYYQYSAGAAMTKANESKFKAVDGSFYLFSWTITFTFDYGDAGVGPDQNLYFDMGSTATANTEIGDGLNAARGFRMAFINQDDTTGAMVWSPFQNKTLDQNPAEAGKQPNSRYVNSATTTADYDSSDTGDLHYMGDPLARIAGQAGNKTRKDYLGTFSASDIASASNVINLTVVVWYEGEDENITTSALMNKVQSSIQFYVRGNAAE